MSAALELKSVSVRRAGRAILSDVSLAIAGGEMLGLVGPNGAGKSTLLRAALGLQPHASGAIELGGRVLGSLSGPERAAMAGYLPQERRVAWSLPAWRIAALGASGLPPAVARQIAHAALERVGLAALADRGVLDMSGGERARVLLARLLATQAPLLVADEPAAGLDPDAQLLVMDLMREEAAKGRAVVVTLHDLTLAARACDRLVVLREGRVAAQGAPIDALTPAVLASVFRLSGELLETAAGLVVSAKRLSN